MKKVYEILGKPLNKGDIGIEIECEGEHLQPVAGYWRGEDDGSLRGRYPDTRAEYVLAQPIGIGKASEALKQLVDYQKQAKLDFSFRTSVHVHINVQPLTYEQLVNFVYLYMLLEEPLMNYCGKERKGNRFCLRLQDAEGILDAISTLITKGIVGLAQVNENNIRYSALNLAALKKYGSVEFRGMRGTLDQGVLNNWCQALFSLRKTAEGFKDPVEIYDLFQKKSGEGFLKLALKDWAVPFIYPKMDQDMMRSYSLSLDIPFMYKKAIKNPK